ncbi:MAG TPA: hypothetical protein VML19_33930 [Verrucomicrobiae bacterium]|nr:hypothetical protein [Verrucomicrobiae bacterium]
MGKLAAALLSLAFVVIPANANAITWNLQGVTFTDGTALTGYFIFDADTGALSNWNLSVLAQPSCTGCLTAFSYTPSSGMSYVSSTDQGFSFFNNAFTRELDLGLVAPLTDSGGTIAIDSTQSVEFSITNSSDFRNTMGGNVDDPAPVSEPASMILAGAALLWAGLLKYHTREKQKDGR